MLERMTEPRTGAFSNPSIFAASKTRNSATNKKVFMPSADLIAQIVPPLISALSGLSGVLLGGILTSRHLRQERRERFISDKLVEFYARCLEFASACGQKARPD